MQPYPLQDFIFFTKLASHVILFLPRNSDLRQIAQLAKEGEVLDVVHYCIGGHSNGLVVWIGDYDNEPMQEEDFVISTISAPAVQPPD